MKKSRIKNKKFAHVPGVVYPAEKAVFKARAPKGWITTKEAAETLGCSQSAARQRLARHGVRHVHVLSRGGGRPAFYRKAAVEKLASQLPPQSAVPDEMLAMGDAAHVLGMARSAVYRYARKGVIRVLKLRVLGNGGWRERCYFYKAEIEALRLGIARQLSVRVNAMNHDGHEN